MTPKSDKGLSVLLDRWHLLAERHSLLKEYLLRPLREATADTSLYNVERHQVLPKTLFKAMQVAYHKAEKDILLLTKAMERTEQFGWYGNGTPYLPKPETK